MGQDPSEIREEIEEARSHMGDTVEALGYKTDVKTRAKESITDKRDRAMESITDKRDRLREQITGVTSKATDATPSTQDVKQNARKAAGIAQENPIGLAIGGVAAGFLVGALMPSTRIENERVGPVADQVKEKAKETGQEALEHGRQVAQDVAESARETAKESGQEHAQEVQSTAQEKAQESVQAARSAGS
jgi:tetrahydromethanopterin S-methyltransferase subunit F